ncbi:hypothetical protein ABFA07_008432 [Porites harrisoni]
MSKRRCFCSNCDGTTRSLNTVKRHRSIYSATDSLMYNSISSNEDLSANVDPKDSEHDVDHCIAVGSGSSVCSLIEKDSFQGVVTGIVYF